LRVIVFVLLLFILPPIALAQNESKTTADSKQAARGKYIVDNVAMCIQCHTPRDAKGELRMTQYLLGAPVYVKAPPFSSIRWAIKAPAIAGLAGYTKEQAITLLVDGITVDGRQPSPPMPPFRMNRADAEAVVTYLKSLK
jgi:mono/diheme cytochrome c family protein